MFNDLASLARGDNFDFYVFLQRGRASAGNWHEGAVHRCGDGVCFVAQGLA